MMDQNFSDLITRAEFAKLATKADLETALKTMKLEWQKQALESKLEASRKISRWQNLILIVVLVLYTLFSVYFGT